MKEYRCWAEVDLDALRANLAWLRHKLGASCRIMTVVKADAYGHGLKQIAALLMQSGTDVFGVANLAEAQSIRSVGRGWPILLLGPCLPSEIDAVVRDDVMPTIASAEEAERLSHAAARLGKKAGVHVKVDTGMGRFGCRPEVAAELCVRVTRLSGLKIEGIYTHYSSVEDDAAFTRRQREIFSSVLRKVRRAGIVIPIVHANNSGGILLEPRSNYDLVRPGLLVYGIIPPGKRTMGRPAAGHVRPVLSFKARVGFVKQVERGARISYGQTFVTKGRMKLATLTVGYGDGFLRAGSNRAFVLVGGRRCRVVGRVTMDQTVVDVTNLDRVQSGDEAVLIGTQGEDRITATELAQWCGGIPWEVLTTITYRVPRIYRGSQAS